MADLINFSPSFQIFSFANGSVNLAIEIICKQLSAYCKVLDSVFGISEVVFWNDIDFEIV